MPHLSALQLILVAGVALAASTLAAVTGFGGAALLLPVLVAVFGVRDAIPILTIAQLFGNGSRVSFNRKEVNWRIVAWYSVGAIPVALLAGALFAKAPLSILTRVVGLYLLLAVRWRHIDVRPIPRLTERGFAGLGAGASAVSALVGSAGPIMAPFFLAYGLVKGAYIGTEAAATVVTHIAKLIAYGWSAVLTPIAMNAGLALGPVMVVGSFIGQRIVRRIRARVFVAVIEATMLLAGLLFLVRG